MVIYSKFNFFSSNTEISNLFESHMLIFLNVMNPTNLTDLSDPTSEFTETSIVKTVRR